MLVCLGCGEDLQPPGPGIEDDEAAEGIGTGEEWN
jgi:hypothetical protein